VILLNTVILEVKKSKFVGYYYKIDSIEEIESILVSLKKAHKKARHLPYAYKFGSMLKKSDDKEPTNTAGVPILNIIEKKQMDNVLIVIVRYFGGVKLGAGGLIRSYGKCANLVSEKENR